MSPFTMIGGRESYQGPNIGRLGTGGAQAAQQQNYS